MPPEGRKPVDEEAEERSQSRETNIHDGSITSGDMWMRLRTEVEAFGMG